MNNEVTGNEKLDRRGFLSVAELTGAGLLVGGQAAEAQQENTHVMQKPETWPSQFVLSETAPKWNPGDMPKAGDKIHEFDIEVTVEKIEILPLEEHHFYTFNKTLPGPVIRVKEGDWVKVNLTNKTHDFHTIHWHGIYVPCEMDGVPLGTQYPVAYNQTFTYLWRAAPPGTHFYHCHNMTNMHIQAGLYGALIIDPMDEDPVQTAFHFEREYTLILSEVDTDFLHEQINEMLEMGVRMGRMNASAKLMQTMDGRSRQPRRSSAHQRRLEYPLENPGGHPMGRPRCNGCSCRSIHSIRSSYMLPWRCSCLAVCWRFMAS